jgi:ATP-binding cassette, subfamily C, bacterial CydD
VTAAVESRMRGPIDPRLWRYSHAARKYLVLSVALSVLITAAIIVSALVIGALLAGIITEPGERTAESWTLLLSILGAAFGIRVVGVWLQARLGHRSASHVVADLEGEALAAAVGLEPRELDSRRGELATVLTRGIGDLRPYLSGYLPALILAVIVPPAVLVVIATQDLISAAIIGVTLPLIPLFMILIGLLTRGKSRSTLEAMSTLSSQLLDLLAGLPTLRALGREQGPQARVEELGDAHRRTAMSALRIAFLSSAVLELLATLCVALVAVSIGLRLVFGEMGLQAAIIALILAPEVYHPLRSVGERFHAAEDGMAAAEKVFGVLAAREATPSAGERRPARLNGIIEVGGLGVRSRDGFAPNEFGAVFRPGSVTVLTGANGSGKSTVLQAVLGLVAPDRGWVTVDGIDVGELDRAWWWDHIAWLPQRPVLVPGTLRENLELVGEPGVDLDRVCAATGFDAVLAELPDGWNTVVGSGGVGLSLGQRQRLALTRTLVSAKPILLLDEPTAHLDSASEATVLESIVRCADVGATVVVVAHRPSVLAAADVIVEVGRHTVNAESTLQGEGI